MLEKLIEVKEILPQLLLDKSRTGEIKTMYIDYHKPFVSRIWFIHNDLRVFLHKIEPCKESSEALYHPHKWNSAMEIISGSYEMGIGHSETNLTPKTDCKIILPAGSMYEMTEKDGWHYVNPIEKPCYTLMITGSLNSREMPIEPQKEFRELSRYEFIEILQQFNTLSGFHINEIVNNLRK